MSLKRTSCLKISIPGSKAGSDCRSLREENVGIPGRITGGFIRPGDAIVRRRPLLTRYLEFKDVFYKSEMAIK